MGNPRIPKPDFWCKEWYIEMKKQGKYDEQLAEELFISIRTFNKWKKDFELPRWAYSYSDARRDKILC